MPPTTISLRPSAIVRLCLRFCVLICTAGSSAHAGAEAQSPARFVPAAGIQSFVEFDGTSAHAEAWSKTAAASVLQRTKAGSALLTSLEASIESLAKIPVDGKPSGISGEWIRALAKHVLSDGLCRAGYERDATVTIYRNMKSPELRNALVSWLAVRDEAKPADAQRRGRKIVRLRRSSGGADRLDEQLRNLAQGAAVKDPLVRSFLSETYCWLEGDDFFTVETAEDRFVDSVIDAIEGKSPSVASKIAAGAYFAGVVDRPAETICRAFADGAALEDLGFAMMMKIRIDEPNPQQKILGYDRLEAQWRLSGPALESEVRLVAAEERRAPGARFVPPTFRRDRLPPIPREVRTFTAIACGEGTFEAIKTGLGAISALEGLKIEDLEKMVSAEFGLRLREDILSKLGPALLVYAIPEKPNDKGEPMQPTLSRTIMAIQLRDPAGFVAILDKLIPKANASLADVLGPEPGDARSGKPRAMFAPLQAPDRGYALQVTGNLERFMPEGVRPVIAIGQNTCVIAPNRELAELALKAERDPQARLRIEGALAAAIEKLPEDLTSLEITDPADSEVPDMIVAAPRLLGLSVKSLERSVTGQQSPRSFIRGILDLSEPDEKTRIAESAEIRGKLFPNMAAIAPAGQGIRLLSRGSIPLGFRYAKIEATLDNHATNGSEFKDYIKLGIEPRLTSGK